ncbi:hypothetical protein BH18ACI4_BH18ACI4_28950 [soil metagenome]
MVPFTTDVSTLFLWIDDAVQTVRVWSGVQGGTITIYGLTLLVPEVNPPMRTSAIRVLDAGEKQH